MGDMTGYVPTFAQIDDLHRTYAPSQAAYDLVHTHCVIVAAIAGALAGHQNALFAKRCEPEESRSPDDLQEGLHAEVHVTQGRAPQRLIDVHLAVVGGLLHDIGTYRVFKHDGSDGGPVAFDGPRYILHGLLGYQLLLDEGVDESVALFARNHTGVGLTREQVIAQGLPLPADDYMPTTLEQEVVMVADKYNSKSTPPKFLTAASYGRKAARFGGENQRRWQELVEQYGEPDIPTLAARFHMRIA